MRRLGLLGGTFDPPHLGHLAVARAVLSAAAVDAILVIPAGDPWQKASRTPAQHRLAMARLAFADEPGCSVSDVEVARPGPSYAIDTIAALRAPGVRLRWILGADALALLPTWHRVGELAQECEFLVVGRPGSAVRSPSLPGLQVEAIPMPPQPFASSELRAAITADGQRPPGLADQVWAYIREHGLYGARHG